MFWQLSSSEKARLTFSPGFDCRNRIPGWEAEALIWISPVKTPERLEVSVSLKSVPRGNSALRAFTMTCLGDVVQPAPTPQRFGVSSCTVALRLLVQL